MITRENIDRIDGLDVYGVDGSKIGSAGQVYLDAQTGDPEWVTVKTGLFGMKETFVPLQRATLEQDRVTLAVDEDTIKDAPKIDPDGALSHEEENELYNLLRDVHHRPARRRLGVRRPRHRYSRNQRDHLEA
ncbi:PRC-barrel domain-containing protein [Actinoplanes sp. NPDC051859]|uniref:PRC-barrel domain-containing protein n=1 Tax=Actinoplanes sp. NPDC051859 TaxID=3363909 RepID=UPI00379DED3D